MTVHITLEAGQITGRGHSLNPFVIVEDAPGFITFAEEVFGAREVVEARTPTPTGHLIHAELRVGDSLLLLADSQRGWQAHPGLFQIWVSDTEDLLIDTRRQPWRDGGDTTNPLLRIRDARPLPGPVAQPLVGIPTRAGSS